MLLAQAMCEQARLGDQSVAQSSPARVLPRWIRITYGSADGLLQSDVVTPNASAHSRNSQSESIRTSPASAGELTNHNRVYGTIRARCRIRVDPSPRFSDLWKR